MSKKRDSVGAVILKKAHGIPVNSSISVLIKNHRFDNIDNIEYITVEVNDIEYSYAKDFQDLLGKYQVDVTEEKTDSIESIAFQDSIMQVEESVETLKYFKKVYNNLNKNKYLNISDLFRIKEYKDSLITLTKNIRKDLTPEEIEWYSKILSWYPTYVSITPISLTVPDADEIEITVSLKEENKDAKEITVGRYFTSGGLAVGVNSAYFLTGLKNNQVFTESVEVNGSNQLRAHLNKENQLSVGIGLASEISYRTGSFIRPILNSGFFVPFEEELTPYFALGAGPSIRNRNVNLSLSYGLAIGKVNAIAERFQNKDLSDIDDLTNENLTEKVWDTSWQIGIGLSFNLNQSS